MPKKRHHRRSTAIAKNSNKLGSLSAQGYNKTPCPTALHMVADHFHANTLKLKTLRILYRDAFCSPGLLALRQNLRARTRSNTVSKFFMLWIEAYSESMRERAVGEWAQARRATKIKALVLEAWGQVIRQ